MKKIKKEKRNWAQLTTLPNTAPTGIDYSFQSQKKNIPHNSNSLFLNRVVGCFCRSLCLNSHWKKTFFDFIFENATNVTRFKCRSAFLNRVHKDPSLGFTITCAITCIQRVKARRKLQKKIDKMNFFSSTFHHF